MSIHNAKFEGEALPPKKGKKMTVKLHGVTPEAVDAAVRKQTVTAQAQLRTEKEAEKKPQLPPRPHELNGKFLHVKVGEPSWDENMLASEIGKVEEKIAGLIEDNNIDCLVFVTHYGVEVKLIEPAK